jgi:hypothetical protein
MESRVAPDPAPRDDGKPKASCPSLQNWISAQAGEGIGKGENESLPEPPDAMLSGRSRYERLSELYDVLIRGV